MDTVDTERGSQKLLEQLFGAGMTSSAEMAEGTLAAGGSNYRLLYWWWKGTPIPDEIFAKVLIERDQAPELVKQFMSNKAMQVNVALQGVGARTSEILVEVNGISTER